MTIDKDFEALRYGHEQHVDCTFLAACPGCNALDRIEARVRWEEHGPGYCIRALNEEEA